jgi:hypothetical protein
MYLAFIANVFGLEKKASSTQYSWKLWYFLLVASGWKFTDFLVRMMLKIEPQSVG